MIVIPRASWDAAPPKDRLTPWTLHQPSGYAIHWEGAGGHQSHALCGLEVKSIQRYHQSHGYDDIAYNWLICMHGVIFEGRPAKQFQSAAQNAGNRTHVAICFMWGPQWDLTEDAKRACVSLIRLAPLPAASHRDIPGNATACPGDEIDRFVERLPVLVSGPASPARPGWNPKPPQRPLPPKGVKHPVLRRGAKGPAVLELQKKLRYGFGQQISLDGDFGPATERAVKNAQRWGHLDADGIAGPKTWGLVDYIAAVKGVK